MIGNDFWLWQILVHFGSNHLFFQIRIIIILNVDLKWNVDRNYWMIDETIFDLKFIIYFILIWLLFCFVCDLLNGDLNQEKWILESHIFNYSPSLFLFNNVIFPSFIPVCFLLCFSSYSSNVRFLTIKDDQLNWKMYGSAEFLNGKIQLTPPKASQKGLK